jgi:SAM-dependent methyltransferase
VTFVHAIWAHYFLRCPNCNIYFISSSPKIEKIRQEFAISDSEEYWLKRGRFVISNKDCEKDWEGWVDWKNKTFKRLNLEEFEKALGESRKALEIGCAEGKVLEILKNRGWKVVGLDISEYETRLCKKLGFNVIVATADKINFRDECFDLIVIFHTLEHTIDPVLVIKNIFTILKKGGRLILEVPCVDSKKSFFVDFKSISHRYFFSENGLEKMLRSNGFTYLDKFIYEDQFHKPKRNICYLVEKR